MIMTFFMALPSASALFEKNCVALVRRGDEGRRRGRREQRSASLANGLEEDVDALAADTQLAADAHGAVLEAQPQAIALHHDRRAHAEVHAQRRQAVLQAAEQLVAELAGPVGELGNQ